MSPALSQVPVGDLHCQRDPYCQEFSTQCIECSESPDKNGFYQVKLHDTILFPEGGGQPFDTGSIDNVKVYNVQRQRLAHVHYTKEPVPVGKTVTVKLDWDRRWDHMQQHTGQHLLSAVLEQEPYLVETVSWNMGITRSYIELDTRDGKRMPTTEQLEQVERRVNQLILEALPVITHTQANDDTDRPESLPDDYVGGGTVRTIEIKGLDRNPCCGTHVAHIGHLQACKLLLLHTEKVRGGNTRLFFLFGQRVLDTFDASYRTSRQLTALLSGPQETLVENVQKLQASNRNHMKAAKRWMAEVAGYAARDILNQLETKDAVLLYRDDADMDFLTLVASGIIKSIGSSKAVVLAAGEKNAGGPIIVTGGSDQVVQQVAKTVTDALAQSGIKGGGKGRWQGKAKNWDGIENLQALLDNLALSS